MDPSNVAQLIILLLLILLSSLFSCAETALITVNKLRIRTLAEENVKGAKTVNKLIEDPTKMLSAVLIGNNIVNLSAAAIATVLSIDVFGNLGAGIGTGIITILILVFGEITPKAIASVDAESSALKYSGFIYYVTKLLTPLIFIVDNISFGILRLFRINPNTKANTITEDELRTLVDVSHEEGVIESEERRMITNVVDFGDSLAKDVMVPRIDMAFANIDLSYNQLLKIFANEKFSRMPVYSETRDNVVGIINLKDVFFYNGSKEDFKIQDIMREPYFTYEFKRTAELLIELRKDSIPLAVVLDEYGATVGLITLEDLIEEIVGEIRDEYDLDEEDSIKSIAENEYMVHGNTKLDEINETIGLSVESDDYDSIAGHIINLLDHLPAKGEMVIDKNVTFTVAAVDKNRIDKVHILVLPESDDPDETNSPS